LTFRCSQIERRRRVEDERRAQEEMEEEDRNMRELNANILAKEKAAEEEKKAAVATKVAVSTVDLAAKRRREANLLKVQKKIAKAEKRAKAVADMRKNGGAPLADVDEVSSVWVSGGHIAQVTYLSCHSLKLSSIFNNDNNTRRTPTIYLP
jgi:hypothetical protein